MVLSFSRLCQSDVLKAYFGNIMAHQVPKELSHATSQRNTLTISWPCASQEFRNLTFRMHDLAIMALRFQKTLQRGISKAYSDNIMALSFPRVPQSDILEAYFDNTGPTLPKTLQCGTSKAYSDKIMALSFPRVPRSDIVEA